MKRLTNSTLFLVLLLTVGLVVAIMEEVRDYFKWKKWRKDLEPSGRFRD